MSRSLLSAQKKLISANGLNKCVDEGAGEYLLFPKPFGLHLINKPRIYARQNIGITSQYGPELGKLGPGLESPMVGFAFSIKKREIKLFWAQLKEEELK